MYVYKECHEEDAKKLPSASKALPPAETSF